MSAATVSLDSEWQAFFSAHNLRLEPMREADLPAVSAIEAQAHFHPWSAQNFADALTAGDRAWVCRQVQGTILAYWVLRQVLDEAELLDITVAPAQQGRGLGRAMLDHLLALAQEAGVATVFLEVRQSNDAARRLYASAGFVQSGLRKAYYPGPNGREDAILMTRQA